MESIDAGQRSNFEDRMLDHLRNLFPEIMAQATEESVRAFIREGTDRAASNGLRSEYDVSIFLTLETSLRPAFAERPEYDWAAQILGDEDEGDPSARLQLLVAEADRRSLLPQFN